MSNLVPYQNHFLIPPTATTVSVAYVLQPNEHDYEGDAAIALTESGLWVCYPDREYEIIPYQNIRETEVKDLSGISYERVEWGKRVYVNPRDAWAVVVKFEQYGSYRYTFTFLPFFVNNAYEWKRKIEQAIGRWDKHIPSEL